MNAKIGKCADELICRCANEELVMCENAD